MLGGYSKSISRYEIIVLISGLLLASIPVFTNAQNTNIDQPICLTYSFNSPVLSKTNLNEVLYDQVTINGAPCDGITGEPYLPSKPACILLPQGRAVDKIEIITGEQVLLGSGYRIEPVGVFIPTSQSSDPIPPQPNETIYHSDTPFPLERSVTIGIQYFKGYPILIIDLHPVEYHPASGILSYYKDITVRVKTIEDKTNYPMFRGLEKDKQEVIKKVDNPSIADTYLMSSESPQRDEYSLLILTNNQLKSSLQRLADAHTTKGMTTTIKTIEDIGSIDPAQIRDYIRTQYEQQNIDYVLIGADNDIIPARYITAGTEIPSDMYYSCLDGSYNHDGDDKWGETHDGENGGDVDLLADVVIGRACVGNSTEVGYFINKTLWYLNQDPSDEYFKKVLLVGQYMCGPIEGKPLTFSDDYMDELIDQSNHNGYTTTGIPSETYSFDKLYDGDWPGWDQNNPWSTGWPETEIINGINSGYHIINHLGHSERFYNMKLDICWRTDDVDRFINDEPCFIYSQGCTAGAFDRNASDPFPSHPYTIEDCIAEYFTVKREHCAFAGIWNAREGWYSPGNTNGPSQVFHRWFWDGVFNQGITEISQANQYSKEVNIPSIHYGGLSRWICFELNYFGDPTLAFRGIPPSPIHADNNGPYYGIIDEPVQYQGSVSGGIPDYTWYWDFGDGNTSKDQNPTHTYAKDGIYAVTLTVNDSRKNSSTDTTTTTINRPLAVNTHGPYSGDVGIPIQFTGSASGGFPSYTWDWHFGDEATSNQQNPIHSYQTGDTYTVTLVVTDNKGHQGTSITSAVITADTDPPTVTITHPEKGYLYVNERELMKRLFSSTPLVIGKITITAEVEDSGSGINCTEFYLDGQLQTTVTSTPYNWTWKSLSFSSHIIQVKVYDNAENNATKEIQVFKIF